MPLVRPADDFGSLADANYGERSRGTWSLSAETICIQSIWAAHIGIESDPDGRDGRHIRDLPSQVQRLLNLKLGVVAGGVNSC
jgi:hypothetical protein